MQAKTNESILIVKIGQLKTISKIIRIGSFDIRP